MVKMKSDLDSNWREVRFIEGSDIRGLKLSEIKVKQKYDENNWPHCVENSSYWIFLLSVFQNVLLIERFNLSPDLSKVKVLFEL